MPEFSAAAFVVDILQEAAYNKVTEGTLCLRAVRSQKILSQSRDKVKIKKAHREDFVAELRQTKNKKSSQDSLTGSVGEFF